MKQRARFINNISKLTACKTIQFLISITVTCLLIRDVKRTAYLTKSVLNQSHATVKHLLKILGEVLKEFLGGDVLWGPGTLSLYQS